MKDRFTRFAEAVRGGYAATAAGDVLGVPVETMQYEEIMKLTHNVGVTEFLKPSLSRFDEMHSLPLGSWSDDTQLMRVTGRSLIRKRGFDIRDQGLGLVEEHRISKFGWGGTTREAAKAIELFFATDGREGRDPATPADPPTAGKKGFGQGSGPAMKILPQALWDLLHDAGPESISLFNLHAMTLGFMTHGDPRAAVASVALGHAIAASGAGVSNADYRKRVLYGTKEAERLFTYQRPKGENFSDRLALAFWLAHDPDKLRDQVNTGFTAMESVPFAIATAMRHRQNLEDALVESASAGRDTDTVASMVGGIIGVHVGLAGIPDRWLHKIVAIEEIMDEADRLSAAAFGHDPDLAPQLIAPWRLPKAQ